MFRSAAKHFRLFSVNAGKGDAEVVRRCNPTSTKHPMAVLLAALSIRYESRKFVVNDKLVSSKDYPLPESNERKRKG